MTVPSASEDANSSDDVYSSVPDTSSENIEPLDERVFHPQRGDTLGPLPALPNSNSKEVNGNAKPTPFKPRTTKYSISQICHQMNTAFDRCNFNFMI